MKLSKNEELVLDLLRKDPFVSQQYIADKLSLSRPSVANVISGMQDKGIILGKPYVLREVDYVTCIGGANMDYTFRLEDEMMMGTSNPVKSAVSFGGVVRNIAENLARLGEDVSLMTLVGDDPAGEELLEKNRVLMETFASSDIIGQSTGGYYSIIGRDGNMVVGYADMSINDYMDRSWILSHKRHLLMSKWMIADTNMTKEAVKTLLELSQSEQIPLALVGVSSPKMKNLPSDLSNLDVLICNLDESQTYFQTAEKDPETLLGYWLEKGINKVVITLGDKGSIYGEKDLISHMEPYDVEEDKIVDTTGAGDAFCGALLYGLINGESFGDSVYLASISAARTIQSKYSVDPSLSIEELKKGASKDES